jgi:hypothetical protein
MIDPIHSRMPIRRSSELLNEQMKSSISHSSFRKNLAGQLVRLGIALVIGVCVMRSQRALADSIRFPPTSPVAFFIQPPPGWHAKPFNNVSLNLEAPDLSSVITVTVLDDQERAAAPETYARDQFQDMHAQPFSDQVTGPMFGGLPATVFTSRMINQNGTHVVLRFAVIPIGGRYVAAEMVASTADITANQQRSLNAALQGIVLGRPIGSK